MQKQNPKVPLTKKAKDLEKEEKKEKRETAAKAFLKRGNSSQISQQKSETT